MVYNQENLVKLGELIRRKREERGYTPTQLTTEAKLSRAHLWTLEIGTNSKTKKKSRPSYELLSRLDRILNLGVEAYRLAGYTPLSEIFSHDIDIELQWNSLLEGYFNEVRTVFNSVREDRRGEVLRDISELLKKYKPETVTQ